MNVDPEIMRSAKRRELDDFGMFIKMIECTGLAIGVAILYCWLT